MVLPDLAVVCQNSLAARFGNLPELFNTLTPHIFTIQTDDNIPTSRSRESLTLSVLWLMELCSEIAWHASVLSSRSHFTTCISMERGPSVMVDSQKPYPVESTWLYISDKFVFWASGLFSYKTMREWYGLIEMMTEKVFHLSEPLEYWLRLLWNFIIIE